MAEPLLSTDRLVKRFGGLLATDIVSIDVRPGEIHALIGPNGAGKTTLVSQLTGNLRPDCRHHPFRRPRRHAPADACAGAARAGALLPDHLGAARVHRPRQCGAGRAGACRPFLPLPGRCTPRREPARAGAAGPRRGGPRRRAPTRSAADAQPRRAAPARDRHGAGRRSPPAAARRADGRHGRGGIAAHDRLPARPQGQARHAADRARHGCRVPARRPHHRAGLWPRHRQRHARGDPRQSRGAPGLSRRGDARDAAGPRAGGLLRREPGAVRHGARRRCRRGRDPDGPQRHGQDDDGERHHGPAAGAPRRRRVRGQAGRSPALLPHRPARPRPGARGPPDLPQPLGAREPSGRRRQPHRRAPIPGRSSAPSTSSRGSPSASATWATSSRAASSRCWRSAAR